MKKSCCVGYILGIISVCLLLNITAVAQESWHLDTLAASHTFTAMGPDSLCLCDDGYPAVAYGGNSLFFAKYTGSYWIVTQVDGSPNVGKFTCLKIDAQGNAHIAYTDWDASWAGDSIKYAYQENNTWQLEQVPTLSDDIGSFSMDLDAAGMPWIAYWDNSSDTLCTVESVASGGWQRHSIFMSTVPLWNIEMVMDGSDPIFAYFAGFTNPTLKLTYDTPSGWETLELDPDPASVTHLDMALEDNGLVHICYKTTSPDALKYRVMEPGGWPTVSEIVDNSATESGQYPSIDLHPITGSPAISYVTGTGPYTLKTAIDEGMGWEDQTVTTSNDPLRFTSIVQGPVGHLHITYFDETEQTLEDAFVVSGSPSFTTVDRTRRYGDPVELVSNPAGNLSLLFNDRNGWKMQLQTKMSGQWVTGPIPGIDEAVYELCADMSHHGYLGLTWTSMSTHALTTGYMTFSEQTDTGWIHETVDMDVVAASVRGKVLFDGQGIPHTLYPSTVTTLRHAWRPGTNWQLTDIFSGWVWCYSMDIDSSGRVHVAFLDTLNNVHYAVSDDMVQWSDEIIDTDIAPEGDTLVQVDALRRPHIVHMDPDTGSIRHFWMDTDQWYDESIPGTAFYDKLKWEYRVSGTDRHDLVLWNNTTNHMHHFWKADAGSAWETRVIDDRDLDIQDVSMTMDPLFRPDIAYYDTLSETIFHATLREPVWYDLGMPATRMLPGTEFQLIREIHNTTASDMTADEYLLLDVYGQYWFAPGWTQEVDVIYTGAHAGTTDFEIPLSFTWPDVSGSATDIRFWGGIVASGTSNLLDYDMVTFEWDE